MNGGTDHRLHNQEPMPEETPFFALMGKFLILVGVILVLVGLLLWFLPKLPPVIGKLPGDFVWRRGNFVVYLPLGTSILLSVLLTLLLWLLQKFFR